MRKCHLTVSSAIEPLESVEVSGLEAFVVSIQRSHHSRPGSPEHQVALTLSLNYSAILVKKLRENSEEWERLEMPSNM